MSTNPAASIADEMDAVIASAAEHDIELTDANFTITDGELFIDGMDPVEWLDAMTMD